jgi:hypothetical protein
MKGRRDKDFRHIPGEEKTKEKLQRPPKRRKEVSNQSQINQPT